MSLNDKVSTGLSGFDRVIVSLRMGDNVVWQVESADDYKKMVDPFVAQAKKEGRRLIYIRFGSHKPLLDDESGVTVCRIDAKRGFESFATQVHELVKKEGYRVFYVFDCLTELLKYWYSDLMIGNFFKVTCPYLFELDTVAYFAIIRNAHTYNTIAGIRDTTQLLLDLYHFQDKLYIHPLKVWQRYSSTMFFPHLIQGQEAICITASSETAELFSSILRGRDRMDYWHETFEAAKKALDKPEMQQEETKAQLMQMLLGSDSRMYKLCQRYFTLSDILLMASREVGTGYIGGKSIGMLVARKILEREGKDRFAPFLESHDSFYVGADVFYTYIVQNGWWRLRTKQKTQEGYYKYAPELKEKLLHGKFSKDIQEQFIQMLEYFGQSPVIVRSSSLLEDNFGNAFAGKYESVFCANQGSPEERYDAFEQAIRTVYASIMSEDALTYRMNRGLSGQDEQMAVLVQRVSGDQVEDCFFPHVAGVGNSSNLYVWDSSIDMNAGMLRLVFGLGTRAVDRTAGDYAKLVCLDNPLRPSPIYREDRRKFSQHSADILSLSENALVSRDLEEIFSKDIKADKSLFCSPDIEAAKRLRSSGYNMREIPPIFDFEKLLKTTEFPAVMRELLALLSSVYDYPVDIEYTANFTAEGKFKINLLQCRPLQTKGLGFSVKVPELTDRSGCFLSMKGSFMGGNLRLPLDYVVYVRPLPYGELSQQQKHAVARQIGVINTRLKGKNVMLLGPGRWGTTTPSLGVPVHFTELSNIAILCEVSSPENGFVPELSYGSHFFQDLVETGIFYAAIFEGQKNVVFHPDIILNRENRLSEITPENTLLGDVIHIAEAHGMTVYADIVSQTLLCL